MKNLDEKTQKKIVAIISALIPQAKIYLFGSRARGTNSEWADIDIALDAGKLLEGTDVSDYFTHLIIDDSTMFAIKQFIMSQQPDYFCK